MEGFELKEFDVLDTPDLGDGGFGIQMSIDMSALSELIGAFGGADAPDLSVMTMRMLIFGRGDYAGAVMHMAFSDSLASSDGDLALARIIDRNLQSAP
jgi:hypothetical protein